MDRILDFLSDYGASFNYQKLPDTVVRQAKRLVIDTLGCSIGCYGMKPPALARAHALEVTSSPGSTILGTRHRSSPELAAFANGVMSRYLDLNDTSMSPKSGHTSDNIMPVLAAAEYADAGLHTAIAGIVLAYEVHDRLGRACTEIRAAGWDYVCYVCLGSAAGAGLVLGLDKEQMANALALAAVSSASVLQTRVGRLSMWKGCAAAQAGRNGVFAALMARRGLTGPEEAFEGTFGFKKMMGASFQLSAFGGEQVPFTIETAKLKCFPCDYEAQCSITPALELHEVVKDKLDDVEKVDIDTYQFALEIAADTRDKWHPASRETADHSIPYVVAVALARGTVWLDDFTEDRIRDPKILALMQKIDVRSTEACSTAWPEAFPFRITVTTKSGERHVREVRYAKGHPKNPMSDEDIEAKFRRLAEPVMGTTKTNTALARLWQLERMKSVKDMLSLFVLDETASRSPR